MLKGEYMAEELEKWRYPRFFSDTIDENDRIIYMNDEDSKHIAQVLRMRTVSYTHLDVYKRQDIRKKTRCS